MFPDTLILGFSFKEGMYHVPAYMRLWQTHRHTSTACRYVLRLKKCFVCLPVDAVLWLQHLWSQRSQVALRSPRSRSDNDGLIWGRVRWVGLLHVPAGRTTGHHGPHQQYSGLSCLDHRYMRSSCRYRLSVGPVSANISHAFGVSQLSKGLSHDSRSY